MHEIADLTTLRLGSGLSRAGAEAWYALATPIPTNDMWLAALVLQHNFALHARDRHFDHLPQLVRV